jgi:hypothetical protein
VKQTYGLRGQHTEVQVAQYYSGSNAGQRQLPVFTAGKACIHASYDFLHPDHPLHPVWQAFSRTVRAEEARLHAECRVGTVLERVEHKLDSLLKTSSQQPPRSASVSASASAAQPEASADLHASMKRGFESVLEAVQDVHSAVQEVQQSKKQHVEPVPVPVAPQYVLDSKMAWVQDRALLAPKLDEYSVSGVWQLFGQSPAGFPHVPSPSEYMYVSKSRQGWLGHLGKDERLRRRGRAYVRVWANVVKLTRKPHLLSEQEACAQLQEAYHRCRAARKNMDFIKWAETAEEQSGLTQQKAIVNWWC